MKVYFQVLVKRERELTRVEIPALVWPTLDHSHRGILSSNLMSSFGQGLKPQIWLFHVVVLQTTAKKWTKVKNARAGRAKLLFLPTKYANL